MLYRGDGPDDLPITARPAKAQHRSNRRSGRVGGANIGARMSVGTTPRSPQHSDRCCRVATSGRRQASSFGPDEPRYSTPSDGEAAPSPGRVARASDSVGVVTDSSAAKRSILRTNAS